MTWIKNAKETCNLFTSIYHYREWHLCLWSFWQKRSQTFPFLLFACLNYRVIFHNSCLWFNIFRFFKVAKYTLRLTHFILCVLELYSRMVPQEVNQNKFSPQIKKVFQRSPEILNKYQSSNTRNTELTNYWYLYPFI